jgi:hypothetical protein
MLFVRKYYNFLAVLASLGRLAASLFIGKRDSVRYYLLRPGAPTVEPRSQKNKNNLICLTPDGVACDVVGV